MNDRAQIEDESCIAEHSQHRAGIVAFLWITDSTYAWNETIATLLRIDIFSKLFIGIHGNGNRNLIKIEDKKITVFEGKNLHQASLEAVNQSEGDFLFIHWPIKPSENFLSLGARSMSMDPRIGTVSFLSNSGGSLSIPHRNHMSPFGVDGFNEASLTEKLRKMQPKKGGLVPIPVAEGAAILVSRNILEVCGQFDELSTDNLALALADMSLNAARRGFNSFLDPHTFITVPWDGVGRYASVLENVDARNALHLRHPHFPACYDAERTRTNSVLAAALDSARATSTGLRVLIDGSALGPKEMGTQLLITKLSLALSERSDVQSLAIAVPEPNNLPPYAQALKASSKNRFVDVGVLDFPNASEVDVIHRPFQPTTPIPWDRWRSLAKRSLVTIQDLIAYRNGAYFENWEEWDAYRTNFNRQVANTDGIISISHDVIEAVQEERLPIDPSRIFVIENGGDARTKDEITRVPNAILEKGWASSPFFLVLGATYAHKNRDLAIRVWQKLRAKGFKHKLILVGASVPFGSTRVEEALLSRPAFQNELLALPEVGHEERNWLLQHTDLSIYLTSAEGFGQLPFEAAQVGVPTLYVAFGPLRELIDDPTAPRSYDLGLLVERAETLLADSDSRKASIDAILKRIVNLSWAETARKSVEAYFEVLNLPARIYRG